jgi:hypothetical protein
LRAVRLGVHVTVQPPRLDDRQLYLQTLEHGRIAPMPEWPIERGLAGPGPLADTTVAAAVPPSCFAAAARIFCEP